MVGGPHDWHFPGTWGTWDFLPNSFGAEFILFIKTRFYGSGHSPPFHGGAPAYYIYISYFGAVWWSNDPGGWVVQWVTLVQFWIGENLACWSNLISLPWHYLYFALNWGFSFWCQIIHESILSWGWNNWNKRSFFLMSVLFRNFSHLTTIMQPICVFVCGQRAYIDVVDWLRAVPPVSIVKAEITLVLGTQFLLSQRALVMGFPVGDYIVMENIKHHWEHR